MDDKIVLGRNCNYQPNMGQASSWCIHSPVVNAFALVTSPTGLAGLEQLHIACSNVLELVYPVTW